MSEEILAETLTIAGDIKNQLKFYGEMGLEDVGGSARAFDKTHSADSAHSISESPSAEVTLSASQDLRPEGQFRTDDHTPERNSQTEQAGLFGEIIPASQQITQRRRPAGVLSMESRDPSIDAIREDIGDCRRCKLHEHRRTIVFGEGDPKAKLVFVGEGPGADEDASGRPFVGRAGQLLDKIIAAMGLNREDVYIANIVKCRPPGNRAPERDEVDTCEPFLFRQLAFIHPEVIVALGSPAFQCLLRTKEPITRARGQWRDWNGIKVMPTFHPAFLLRSPDKKREVWEDMKKVRDYLSTKQG